MTATGSEQAATPEFIIPACTANPADLLESAGAVLCFLNLVIGGYDDLSLSGDDSYGLSLILGGVQHSINQAAKQL